MMQERKPGRLVGVVVKCPGCGQKTTLDQRTFNPAQIPPCERCLMPQVLVPVKLKPGAGAACKR
jgi:hypothetical protein